MEDLPSEIQSAICELERDYEGFEFHPVGANGYLLFARNRISQAQVAIKFYYGAPGERRHDEPRLLASINSPNVLRIIDARHLSDQWAFFLTPKCDDGDLDALIATRPAALTAIDTALGICTGASAIHASSLVHRDLKPGNIVSENGIPLIADFGSVRQLAEGEADTPASGHSALYRPPEAFDTGRYGVQGDIYQVGLVTYQLLGGALPYDPLAYFTKSDSRAYADIKDGFEQSKYQDAIIHRRASSGNLMDLSSLPPWIGGSMKSALRSMTDPDLKKRLISMADVAAALTRGRADTANWKWVNDVARLEKPDRIVELRPLRDGSFEPLQSKGDLFRRVPSLPNGPLKGLVKRMT
jgi:eukaryotic-like serine/threonine-protein kinase